MKRIMSVAVVLALLTTALPARSQGKSIEIRPFVGAYVPTGTQHAVFGTAAVLGMQAAIELRPNLHLVGGLSWVPAMLKFESTNDHVKIFSQDIGMETDLLFELRNGWVVKPFAGAGVGIRNYLYSADELKSQGGPLGYGALGSELEIGAVAFRLEARGHVYRYRLPISGGEHTTRNDMTIALGMAYHLR